jgi:hypothetical protein
LICTKTNGSKGFSNYQPEGGRQCLKKILQGCFTFDNTFRPFQSVELSLHQLLPSRADVRLAQQNKVNKLTQFIEQTRCSATPIGFTFTPIGFSSPPIGFKAATIGSRIEKMAKRPKKPHFHKTALQGLLEEVNRPWRVLIKKQSKPKNGCSPTSVGDTQKFKIASVPRDDALPL